MNWNNSFLLPFGFIDGLGWVTPAIVTFITYAFTALETLADGLEEPFGMAQNDLALDAMSKTIENTLREMNGEVIVQETPAGDYLS
ncbi:bestrophin family ion channel [Chitinophaga sp.]|uniref:bestrophin family ion channel n=1 Tax=Chitinophaga sp. TaxID=1869181 RepID=UPI0031D67C76